MLVLEGPVGWVCLATYFLSQKKEGDVVQEGRNGGYDASGSITKKTTYKYDEKGNMLERVHYDASGNLTGKTTSKYDEKGNKVAWWTYELKAGFGEKRLVSIEEETWEFTYWD